MKVQHEFYAPTNDPWIKSINRASKLSNEFRHPMLAFDKSYIVFDYDGGEFLFKGNKKIVSPRAYIKPPRDHFFNYKKTKGSCLLVIVMHPLAFSKITKRSASDYQEGVLHLNEIIKEDLFEHCYWLIGKAETLEEVHVILSEILFNELQDVATPIDAMVNEIVQVNGMISVEELMCKSKSSMSTLLRYFKQHLGMTPALFLRLVKFNALLLQLGAKVPMHELILMYDFFDQTHLTRDFLKFAGVKPKEYLGVNYQLLHEILSTNNKRAKN